MNDQERASQVFETCLSVIPHKKFSFSKIWVMAAKLYVRRRDLQSARKLLGKAIGLCGKEKIFIEYIALELALGEVDRCRSLYTNYLKSMPHNCRAWAKYAELEKSVGETEVSLRHTCTEKKNKTHPKPQSEMSCNLRTSSHSASSRHARDDLEGLH